MEPGVARVTFKVLGMGNPVDQCNLLLSNSIMTPVTVDGDLMTTWVDSQQPKQGVCKF